MDLKIVSRALMIFGIIIIIYALNYDTTVGTSYGNVVNIHKSNHQSNSLLLGSILFIAGIILFASWKSKEKSGDVNILTDANIKEDENNPSNNNHLYNKINSEKIEMIRELAKTDKIKAIKEYMSLTDVGLKQAKDAVEDLTK